MLWILDSIFNQESTSPYVFGIYHFVSNHEYISLYLLGCIVAALLWCLRLTFFWCINWILRHDVLVKNSAKILPPDAETREEKDVRLFKFFAFNFIFSWFAAVEFLWSMVIEPLRILRDQVQPAPECIKELRFPLRNNPDMPRESVWAYLAALHVRAGNLPLAAKGLADSLFQIEFYYPSFNKIAALDQLERLDVIQKEVLSSVRSMIRE